MFVLEKKFIIAIEESYDFKIENVTIAPRQYVAETYILSDKKQNKYFCKLVDKPLFIPQIIKSLPVVYEMHENDIQNISYPIKTKKGFFYILLKDTLIVLFNYIQATQSFDYDLKRLGETLAKIHNVTPKIKAKIPDIGFDFVGRKLFKDRFERFLSVDKDNLVIKEFKMLLKLYESDVRYYMDKFLKLSTVCKKERYELSVTHGDVYTNILVKSKDDFYIIDWDELRLAPAERDLWMHDEKSELIVGYKNVRVDFIINEKMRAFCILQYYFERMNYYFTEILNETKTIDYRLSCIKKLSEGKMAGWILPKVESVKSVKF